jgi:hypothetical protein
MLKIDERSQLDGEDPGINVVQNGVGADVEARGDDRQVMRVQFVAEES